MSNIGNLIEKCLFLLTEFVNSASNFFTWCITPTQILGMTIYPALLISFDIISAFLVVRVALSINQ